MGWSGEVKNEGASRQEGEGQIERKMEGGGERHARDLISSLSLVEVEQPEETKTQRVFALLHKRVRCTYRNVLHAHTAPFMQRNTPAYMLHPHLAESLASSSSLYLPLQLHLPLSLPSSSSFSTATHCQTLPGGGGGGGGNGAL